MSMLDEPRDSLLDCFGGWRGADLGPSEHFRIVRWHDADWIVTPHGHPLIAVAVAHADCPSTQPSPSLNDGPGLNDYVGERSNWMREAGFNSFSYTRPENESVHVPWVATLPLIPGFINLGPRGFDPFDAAWRRSAAETIAKEIPALIRDRRVIGVSLSYPVMASPWMVPEWMWKRLQRAPTNLLLELKKADARSSGKRAYIDYLEARYGSLQEYARVRGSIPAFARGFRDLLPVDLAADESPFELHPDDAPFYRNLWFEAAGYLVEEIRRYSGTLIVFSPRVIGLRRFPDPWLDAWIEGVGPHVDAFIPELYACDPYMQVIEHIGALTGKPSFIGDGMRPGEFNYERGLQADEEEARTYRRMFGDLLSSRWFLGGTVCEYRPRCPEFPWYAKEPTRTREGIRNADFSDRGPLFNAYRDLHQGMYQERLRRLADRES